MPKTEVDTYIVYPTRYDELIEFDEYCGLDFCFFVVNGHKWGWSVHNRPTGGYAMNRKGQFIIETRSDGARKKPRRFSEEEAIALAEKFIDKNPHLVRCLKLIDS